MYPISFTHYGNAVCQIVHKSAGWSNICIDTYSTSQFTCWAFNEGQTFSGEHFMYVAAGF